MSEVTIQMKKCVTPIARASYVSVFRPAKFDGQNSDQESKYSITLIFEKTDDLSELKRAVFNALVEKHGSDKTKWPKDLKLPFRDGSKRADKEGYGPDKVFITATSKSQPGIVDARVQKIIDEQLFYSGCYCRAELIAFYYDAKGNKGVSFSLQNVQKVRDGKPFSGKKAAEEVFDAVDDGAPSEFGTGDEQESNDPFGL
jgi:hypothetical protein